MVASAIVEEKHSNSFTVGNKVFHKDKFYLHDKTPHSKFHTKIVFIVVWRFSMSSDQLVNQ